MKKGTPPDSSRTCSKLPQSSGSLSMKTQELRMHVLRHETIKTLKDLNQTLKKKYFIIL